MNDTLHVLIVEDAPEDAELAVAALRRAGVAPVWRRVDTEAAFVAALAERPPDVIISDYSMPTFDGMAALRIAAATVPDVPFIVCTGSINEETAVECMKAGAWDYVLKDRLSRLPLAVRGALGLARSRRERWQTEADLQASQLLTQSIIDSLASSVAVVSPDGEILRVNGAWRAFAEANGGNAATIQGVGLNYFDATRAAMPDPVAAAVLSGMQAVLDGDAPSFSCTYGCHSPKVRRWFVLDVTPLAGARAGLVTVHTDVSERKRAQDALAESEQRYRSLFEQSPIGIYRTTPDGRILMVNRAILEMLGFPSLDALAARNLEEAGFLQEGARQRFKELLAQHGDVRGLESTWYAADGRELLVIENARAIRAADGAILHYEGTVEDVTARRLAERQVETERARFRVLTESAPFGMRLSCAEGAVTYVNPAWVELFGFTLEETPTLEACRAAVFLEPGELEMAARGAAEDRAARQRGETTHRQVRVTCKDGRRKVVLMVTAPLSEGQVLTTCIDLTASVAAQEAQRRLAAAVENAAEGMVITDGAGTIEYVNPAFERITGYARIEVIGRNPRILKSGRQEPEFYAALWRTISAGETWRGRFVNRRKDGSFYEEDATIAPIRDERGRIAHFVSTKRDVTREIRLQEQLNQAQKMEAVGRLAGGIAHDFNNLLQAVTSEVSVLRHLLPGGGAFTPSLDDLDRLVRRGAGLTRQLLLFSRQQVTQVELLDLTDVIRGAASMLRRIVRENVEISLDVPAGDLPVRADRGQLEQVVMNLVVNASDAMPGGGQVRLAAGAEGATVWFSVADEGPGIPEAVLPHLFEPFFTTKAPGKGTGLGLSVVHGIVTAHGGSIDVSSGESGGARFTVRLPRSTSSARAEAAPSAGAELTAGGGERILVVEDEEGARTGLAALLGMIGYEVTAVGSGGEARALRPEEPYDLLLTDVLLPDAKGDALAEELKRRWPRVEVVLMSGYSEDVATRRQASDSAVRFLQKPFDAITLAAAIRAALDSR